MSKIKRDFRSFLRDLLTSFLIRNQIALMIVFCQKLGGHCIQEVRRGGLRVGGEKCQSSHCGAGLGDQRGEADHGYAAACRRCGCLPRFPSLILAI